MTEIAASAGAAIGSLYRFFPTKEVLADALVARYGEALLGAFAEVEVKAASLSPDALAGALIEMMQSVQPSRAVTIALAETRRDLEKRSTLRGAIRAAIAAILLKAAPGLPPGDLYAVATLLQQLLKFIRALPSEDAAADARLAVQARAVVARYLAGLMERPVGG